MIYLSTAKKIDQCYIEGRWGLAGEYSAYRELQATNEYLFFLFLIRLWYYEKNIPDLSLLILAGRKWRV